MIGSDVATLWIEDNKPSWYLGVIDSIGEAGVIMVSSMEWMDGEGLEWVYHEEAKIGNTKIAQILKTYFHLHQS